jgi:hypothetical protein
MDGFSRLFFFSFFYLFVRVASLRLLLDLSFLLLLTPHLISSTCHVCVCVRPSESVWLSFFVSLSVSLHAVVDCDDEDDDGARVLDIQDLPIMSGQFPPDAAYIHTHIFM